MSSINLSDILDNLEQYFETYGMDFAIELNGEEMSWEDAQKALDNGVNINELAITVPEGGSFGHEADFKFDWSVDLFCISISQSSKNEYVFDAEIDIMAHDANDDIQEYSERDDFDDIAYDIWEELKKEGYSFAKYHNDPWLELDGDYTQPGVYAKTLEEALIQLYEHFEYLIRAIETMEEYYSRFIKRVEEEEKEE